MVVRFDDSLPILVDIVAKELGPEAVSEGAALRDMSGRLAFFSAVTLDASTIEKLSERLRDPLEITLAPIGSSPARMILA